ncbi:hypothetical protein FPOAC1_010960 [Fusarium poae]|uniref:hypothetical protein n=1 Tax=Fusarium poae TaxID=36050 RepID=UPI001CEBC77B|nr:hypothetical protein FPOAC1_010960 [Fusarium poae]KAG8666157.1 hypothetical protein FPOAC1_010960 [Fusarium poae]
MSVYISNSFAGSSCRHITFPWIYISTCQSEVTGQLFEVTLSSITLNLVAFEHMPIEFLGRTTIISAKVTWEYYIKGHAQRILRLLSVPATTVSSYPSRSCLIAYGVHPAESWGEFKYFEY